MRRLMNFVLNLSFFEIDKMIFWSDVRLYIYFLLGMAGLCTKSDMRSLRVHENANI